MDDDLDQSRFFICKLRGSNLKFLLSMNMIHQLYKSIKQHSISLDISYIPGIITYQGKNIFIIKLKSFLQAINFSNEYYIESISEMDLLRDKNTYREEYFLVGSDQQQILLSEIAIFEQIVEDQIISRFALNKLTNHNIITSSLVIQMEDRLEMVIELNYSNMMEWVKNDIKHYCESLKYRSELTEVSINSSLLEMSIPEVDSTYNLFSDISYSYTHEEEEFAIYDFVFRVGNYTFSIELSQVYNFNKNINISRDFQFLKKNSFGVVSINGQNIMIYDFCSLMDIPNQINYEEQISDIKIVIFKLTNNSVPWGIIVDEYLGTVNRLDRLKVSDKIYPIISRQGSIFNSLSWGDEGPIFQLNLENIHNQILIETYPIHQNYSKRLFSIKKQETNEITKRISISVDKPNDLQLWLKTSNKSSIGIEYKYITHLLRNQKINKLYDNPVVSAWFFYRKEFVMVVKYDIQINSETLNQDYQSLILFDIESQKIMYKLANGMQEILKYIAISTPYSMDIDAIEEVHFNHSTLNGILGKYIKLNQSIESVNLGKLSKQIETSTLVEINGGKLINNLTEMIDGNINNLQISDKEMNQVMEFDVYKFQELFRILDDEVETTGLIIIKSKKEIKTSEYLGIKLEGIVSYIGDYRKLIEFLNNSKSSVSDKFKDPHFFYLNSLEKNEKSPDSVKSLINIDHFFLTEKGDVIGVDDLIGIDTITNDLIIKLQKSDDINFDKIINKSNKKYVISYYDVPEYHMSMTGKRIFILNLELLLKEKSTILKIKEE